MIPAHLKPLRYDIGNLPNQVNQEFDISEMEIITDLVALSGFVMDRAKNDRVKADLTIETIKKKPEIITYFKDSKSLSGFINNLGIKTNCDKTDLTIAIIKNNLEILGNDNKEEKLSYIIKSINLDYFPKSILKILKTLPQELISFVKLNNNLYPKSDHLKKDLIIEAIEQGVLDQNNFLKCGFDDLENKDFHLKILKKAKEKGIAVTSAQPLPSSILSVIEPSVPTLRLVQVR